MSSIIHHHPHGAGHVLALYGEDGLEFHLAVAHEITDSGEMDAHEQDVAHQTLHALGDDGGPVDEDHLVDPELLADAIGPVPLEEFYLRPSCAECTRLSCMRIGPESEAKIREHVLASHAHQVVLPSGHDPH